MNPRTPEITPIMRSKFLGRGRGVPTEPPGDIAVTELVAEEATLLSLPFPGGAVVAEVPVGDIGFVVIVLPPFLSVQSQRIGASN